MKAIVFYDSSGNIQSVMKIHDKAYGTPTCADHSSIEVDLETLKVQTLSEVHFGFRVDSLGKLQPREGKRYSKRTPKRTVQ